MERLKNTLTKYGLGTILFHWIMAIIVIGLLCLGLYMSDLTFSPQKLRYYRLHKEFGILVLGLVILRVLWRLSNVTPLFDVLLPSWQKLAARSVHYLFYVLMFAMPLTGWLMSSAAGLKVSFFGLFVLPNLIAPDDALKSLFVQMHTWIAYTFIITICLHIAAVFQHYFFYKENIFRRMWP